MTSIRPRSRVVLTLGILLGAAGLFAIGLKIGQAIGT